MGAKQARTKLKVDDSGAGFPKVQITYMKRVPGPVKIAEAYGTHGSAPKETACLLFCINGDEGNKFIIPLSAQTRPKNLKEGEFVCGNFKKGTTILFDESGHVTISNGTDDLVDLIKQLCEALTNMTTITALGPQAPVNLATFTALLPKFESFVK